MYTLEYGPLSMHQRDEQHIQVSCTSKLDISCGASGAQVGHAKSVARAARDNGFCATFHGDADNATANLLALLELWPSWRLPRALALAGEAAFLRSYATIGSTP